MHIFTFVLACSVCVGHTLGVYTPAHASDAKDALSALLFAINPTGGGSIVRASARQPAVLRKGSADMQSEDMAKLVDDLSPEEKGKIFGAVLDDLSPEEKKEIFGAEGLTEGDETEVFEVPDLPFRAKIGHGIADMIDEWYNELGLESLDGDASAMYEEALRLTSEVTGKYEREAKETVNGWFPRLPSDEVLERPMSLGSMGIEELEKQIEETRNKYDVSKYMEPLSEAGALIANMPDDESLGKADNNSLSYILAALVNETAEGEDLDVITIKSLLKKGDETMKEVDEGEDLEVITKKSLLKKGDETMKQVDAVTSGLEKVVPQIEALAKDIASASEDYDTILEEALK